MDIAQTALLPPDVQFALCDISATPNIGRAYTYAPILAKDGADEVEPPTEILLWRAGITKTTKGNFLLDDKALAAVWADWQQRMGGVVSPSGAGPGSFDYDHDEWNPNLPGYMKLSAGSFDLGKDGKDLWMVKCDFTELADGQIRRKEKRSTSPAFDFDPKTGRFLRLYNCAITNVPATHKQALLASLGTPGELLLPPPEQAADKRVVSVQVPLTFEIDFNAGLGADALKQAVLSAGADLWASWAQSINLDAAQPAPATASAASATPAPVATPATPPPAEPPPAVTSDNAASTPAAASAPAVTTRSENMWYERLGQDELVMYAMGETIERLFLSATLAKKCSAGSAEQKMFTAQMDDAVNFMSALSSYAAKVSVSAPEAVVMDMDEDETEMMSVLSADHQAVVKACLKFGAVRPAKQLAGIQAQLGVSSITGLRPEILSLKTELEESKKAAADAVKLATDATKLANSNTAGACRALVAQLQSENLMSAALAQEALGVDPVTGKPRMITLSGGKSIPADPWTIGELRTYEAKARERLKSGGPAALASVGGGAPPPATASADKPATAPALPAGSDPSAIVTEEEIAFVIAAVEASGASCTREEAVQQLKANKAGKFGPEASRLIAASNAAKPGKTAA